MNPIGGTLKKKRSYQCQGINEEGSLVIRRSDKLRNIAHVVSPYCRVVPRSQRAQSN